MVLGYDNSKNFELVFDPTTFHLYKKSSHGSLRLGIVGWKVIV